MSFVLIYLIPIILGVILLELLRQPLSRFVVNWRYDHVPRFRKEVEEDILKILYHASTEGRSMTIPSLARESYVHNRIFGDLRLSLTMVEKVASSLHHQAYLQGGTLELSEEGSKAALRIIRRHRLYEKFLAEYSGYAPDEWHERAERMEHRLSKEDEKRLAELLRYPHFDPHGSPIPNEDGEVKVATKLGEALPDDALSLSDLPAGKEAKVIGVAATYRGLPRRRLLDLGFVPDSRVEVDLVSPFGNPRGYLIHGTTIALRRDQAKYVMVRPLVNDPDS